MHIDPLYPVSAGLVRGVNDHLLNKLPQDCQGQIDGFGVLLHDFHKALDIDRLGFGGGYNLPQFLYGLLQLGLFLFVSIGQLCKPLHAQRPRNTILVKPLNNRVQFVCPPLLLVQPAPGLFLFRLLYSGFVLYDTPYKRILVILCIGNHPLQILKHKLFKHHGPDIMGGTLAPCLIICADIVLLLFRI